MEPEVRKLIRDSGRFGAVGLEMGISVAIGLFAGRWLDGRFDCDPWLTILGALFGLGAAGMAGWRVYRAAKADIAAMDGNGRT